MKQITPNYYVNFKCIAAQCRHNCCIGWEIDIDEDTYALYRTITGEMGCRLKESISPAEIPHFILDDHERCPFLNGQGLCDIITELGEDHLCQICADHPRFRNEFSTHTEMGLGLCCEAAADLILNQTEKTTLQPAINESALLPEEQFLYTFRRRIFDILQDRKVSMEQRLSEMLSLYNCKIPDEDWCAVYRSLERLDPVWEDKIESINVDAPLPDDRALPLEQLAVYFIYRHLAGALEDGRFAERIAFCALSVRVVNSIARYKEELCEIARLYSSEIEYSDENIDILLNRLN